MTSQILTYSSTYLSVAGQKMPKIDETVLAIEVSYFPLIWFLSGLLRVYQLDVQVDFLVGMFF